ncbi:MAG: hypothetical protein HRU20_08850 [Pseudomonadales bacterium]|nr:hypothetical protein [Pseudomonadales bacterium]
MHKYAPEYTKAEKLRLILKELIWAVPLYLVCEFWFFDWLSEYSKHSNCYFYGPITGLHLVMYGLFFLMPFCFGVISFHLLGKDALRVIKAGQHPLPNKKVFSKTKYVYGNKAKIKGYITVACVSAFFIISAWGITAANKLTSDIKPCDKPLINSSSLTVANECLAAVLYV